MMGVRGTKNIRILNIATNTLINKLITLMKIYN